MTGRVVVADINADRGRTPPRPDAGGPFSREVLDLIAHAPQWFDARVTRAVRACGRSSSLAQATREPARPHLVDLRV